MADYAKGQVLRELRAQSRLSREKVAAEIGVTTKTLYSWENDGGIKIDNATRLAAFYGVEDPASLVTRSTDGGDQLDRIERKLDMLIDHFGLIDHGEEFERELAAAAQTSASRGEGSGRAEHAHQRATQ